MARTPATHLEGHAFAQATAALARARPSPRQDQLFRLLNVAVWSAVGLTGLYLGLRLSGLSGPALTVRVARAIAVVYIVIVPLFAANWRLVWKLWRAAQFRRTLGASLRERLADLFKRRRRARRLVNFATLLLSIAGAPIAALGLLGLTLELLAGAPFNASRLTLYVVAAVFGLSCVFLHFMARGRERLMVLDELWASLHNGRLSDEDYDEITHIERGQISADRRRSVRSASSRALRQTYASKEHRAVRDAKLALAPETLVRVQACIDALVGEPRAAAVAATRDGVSYVRVPDTPLEVGFTVDWDAREIRLLSLQASGRGGQQPAAGEER